MRIMGTTTVFEKGEDGFTDYCVHINDKEGIIDAKYKVRYDEDTKQFYCPKCRAVYYVFNIDKV